MLAIEAIKRVQNYWKYVCVCVYSIKWLCPIFDKLFEHF